MITRIVSGGQTGVDRAALDVALALGVPCGGWCPRGRRAEDGPIPDRYPLTETLTAAYPERTEGNIRDSDGTLILTEGQRHGGTALTIELAGRLHKPYLVVDLTTCPAAESVQAWLRSHHIGVLNVAGPREGDQPGIYRRAAEFVRQVLGASDAFARPQTAFP